MMPQWLLLCILLATSPVVMAQNSLRLQQMPLDSLAWQVLSAPSEKERLAANAELVQQLRDTLWMPEVYAESFDGLKSISRLRAPDNRFQLWTWQLPRKGGRFHHMGMLIIPGKEQNRLVVLADSTDEWELPLHKELKVQDWQGALYYHIEQVKLKKKTYYTLLGYDQHDLQVRRKWVDALYIDEDDDRFIRFGAPIFHTERFQGEVLNKRPYRLVMQYSAAFSAMLRWEEDEKRLLMDHLEPQDAKMKRMYRFYGPDFTYDALVWSKKGWELEENVEVRSRINAPIVPPNKGTDLGPEGR